MAIVAITANIAELKNRLSFYLKQVRAGAEVIIRDRNLPIAKLVPLGAAETSAEELALAAAGKLTLPQADLDEEAFWAWDAEPVAEDKSEAIRDAVSADRSDRDDGVLGR